MKYNPTLYVGSVCFVSIQDSVALHWVVNPTVHHLAPAHEGRGICKTHLKGGNKREGFTALCRDL